MILIVLLAAVYSMSSFFDLPAKLSEHSLMIHHFCLQMLPTRVENHGSLEALVCGKNMQELELQQLLVQSSLIHVFIVSGSHFLFLHKLLARVPIVRFCPLLVLSVYCLATLCQPPALRSLLFLSLVSFTKQQKRFPSPVILVFISCAFSVCIFPQWITSRSLLMSLLAALTIAVMSEFWGKNRGSIPEMFATQSTIYVVMAFCLWGFSNLHPLSILMNMIFAPLIGAVIFPLALLVIVLPPLGFVFDAAMNALIWILRNTSEVLGENGAGELVPVVWQWTLFLVLTAASYSYLIQQKRRKVRRA
ncbi:MAG: ComEC/Rec2 family competence protein [Bdellovibrionales bacterium]|nr:ComEC/Rec2 family competence protein [Bdellovibrionales bacterium]